MNEEGNGRFQNRTDIKMIVGEALNRLSSLDGMSFEVYKSLVLPELLRIIKESQDSLS